MESSGCPSVCSMGGCYLGASLTDTFIDQWGLERHVQEFLLFTRDINHNTYILKEKSNPVVQSDRVLSARKKNKEIWNNIH